MTTEDGKQLFAQCMKLIKARDEYLKDNPEDISAAKLFSEELTPVVEAAKEALAKCDV